MRLRLLRRRLTISAPRVAVRSAMPWPLRWLLGAMVLGFSGALALWAFEFGKDIAGLDRQTREELLSLRQEVQTLQVELAEARTVANTVESTLTTERTVQAQLALQIRQLEADNQALRSDLGFFENLIPDASGAPLAIRGLHVDRLADGQWRWQVLMIQADRKAPEFQGQLEIRLDGTLAGKPWSMTYAGGPQPIRIKRYLRQDGMIETPPQAMVKSITARLLQSGQVRASQTMMP